MVRLYTFPVALSAHCRDLPFGIRAGLVFAFRLALRHGWPSVSLSSNALGQRLLCFEYPGDAAWLDIVLAG